MPQATFAPTPHTERLVHLDVLRGFALLGILLVNFAWFSRPILEMMLGPLPPGEGVDAAAAVAVQVLAEGKFYALFSMLFGAGFALMFERARHAGGPFNRLFLRRLGLLFVFGLLHGLFIWSGDILLVYSLVGFLLWLLFSRAKSGLLLIFAGLLMFIPSLLVLAFAGMLELARFDQDLHQEITTAISEDAEQLQQRIERGRAIYVEGSFAEAVGQRARELWSLLSMPLFWVPPIIAYFLIGTALMRSGRLKQPDDHPRFYARLIQLGLVPGLVFSALGVWLMHSGNIYMPDFRLAAASFFMQGGAVLLSLAWLALVVRYYRALEFLAPAGRMALTLYLMQSVFWTLVFYGYGLGLPAPGAAMQVMLALGFFALQVVFAHLWLARFRYGPMEWVWRSLTYGKAARMRG